MADGDVTWDGYELAAYAWLIACAKLMGSGDLPVVVLPEIRESLAQLLRVQEEQSRGALLAQSERLRQETQHCKSLIEMADKRIANLTSELAAADKRADAKLAEVTKERDEARSRLRTPDPSPTCPRCGGYMSIFAVGGQRVGQACTECWGKCPPGVDRVQSCKPVDAKPRWSCTCVHAPEQHGKYGCLVMRTLGGACTCITPRS